MIMSKVKEPAPRFRVGDWVSLLYGLRKVRAQIIEDRGPLGVGGRRIYRLLPTSIPETKARRNPSNSPRISWNGPLHPDDWLRGAGWSICA